MSWENDWVETVFGRRIKTSRIIEYVVNDYAVDYTQCTLDNGTCVAIKVRAEELDVLLGRNVLR